MGDRKHHEPPKPPPSSAADDLGLGLPTELSAEEQEAPGLKSHGDKLGSALEPAHHDPTAQPDGDDGNPETGARGAEELAETRGRA